MRKNLPVTDHEYVLSNEDTIVSKTDIKGRITYVNQDFVRISGFSAEELIGKSHNIVRHPDMPPEAFADLWKTLQAGKAWTGLVKNRTKTGDYYWVEANAAPIRENGHVIGYTSVRTKAIREQIEAAELAYAEIRQGKTDLVIDNGSAVRRNVLHTFSAILNTSIMLRVYAAMSVMSLLFLAIGIGAWADALSNRTLLTLTAFGVLLALLSSLAIRRTVLCPIEQARAEIDRMAAGDLSAKIVAHRADELSEVLQSLRVLQTNMKLLVGQIKEASHQVNLSSRGIAAGNLELSSRTESQAGALQETAASMEQLTGTVKDNAGNAQEASGLAVAATEVALKGGQVVSEVVSTMNAIKSSSGRIVDIIGVIDSIAFQTNVLALNAAVEAARAGSQGRGFAIVAAEVRNLAQRAAGAAKEIKVLINDTVSRVEAGSEQVNDAGQIMKEIVESIQHASLLMQKISKATVEQSLGIEHVNLAVTQMDKVTLQNAALVEEAAAAADNLQGMASNLVHLVESFRLTAPVNELADTICYLEPSAELSRI